MAEALWKRDPARWQRIRQAQLGMHPTCCVCGHGELPALTLTAHHLNYERDRFGYEPMPGQDLVTIHHETCHAFVEWLVENKSASRGGAHLRAKALAPDIVRSLGIQDISQWYEKGGASKTALPKPGAPYSKVMRNSMRQALRYKRRHSPS